jgi:transcriptional regulator with XRE-family HTH domain
MTERESFGPTLRHQRERRGLTLDAVAESTKVSPFLLASLERGDVSRWPVGIYRRSFLRVYAGAIGLPPEPTLREFLRLFPEPGQHPPASADAGAGVRLTLLPESRWAIRAKHGVAAVGDVVAELLLGYGVSLLSGEDVWRAAAVAGLTYYGAGTVLFGRSPAMRFLTTPVAGRASSSVTEDLGALRRRWMVGWMGPAKNSSEHRATT